MVNNSKSNNSSLQINLKICSHLNNPSRKGSNHNNHPNNSNLHTHHSN